MGPNFGIHPPVPTAFVFGLAVYQTLQLFSGIIG